MVVHAFRIMKLLSVARSVFKAAAKECVRVGVFLECVFAFVTVDGSSRPRVELAAFEIFEP
jgi:hypothetical protein